MMDIFINMGYIYLLTDKRNGKQYVGKHNGSYRYYWSGGLIPNKIADKHGKDVFDRVILEDNISDDLLNEREVFYIEQYNTIIEGYNLTKGGDGGGSWINYKTEEERDLISKKKSVKLKGRVISEETKSKMSESGKIKHFTDEHKKNIGESIKKRGGIPHTEETKKKLSRIMSGRKNDKHSEFMKKNNPKARKVSINGVTYNTIKEASEKLDMARHLIKNRLNSKNKKYINWYKL